MEVIRLVIDTNAYSAFKRGDKDVREFLGRAEEILVPVPVIGELRAGFKLGSQERSNLKDLELFLSNPRVFVPQMGSRTSLFYAEIFASLRRKGTPIPSNDVWIAACTLEAGAVLLSFDAHFKHVDGLLLNTI